MYTAFHDPQTSQTAEMPHHTILWVYAAECSQIPFPHFLVKSIQVDFASQPPPFSSQSSGIPTVLRQASDESRIYNEDIYSSWSGVTLFFQVMNVVIWFLTFQYLFRLRKIILEWLWVDIRISHFAEKISCIRKMAWDWKISSQEALRDYKSCERQHLITEDAIHRGTEGTARPLWEAPPSSEGPRGCNHQQHDHDWRTTSRRETASWEESCWWV